MNRITSGRFAAATGTLVIALTLGGCAAIGDLLGGGPDRDADTGEFTESGDVDVFDLQVGDCLNLGETGELSSAAVVPCSEPHTEEIFHEFQMEDGDWPGEDAVEQAADEGCYAAFEAFVGTAYEDSTLDYVFLSPLEDGWNDPNVEDRLVQCVIYEPTDDGPKELTGSLEGAAR
ncbi:septum formation family protein [Microbacterium sp. JZ31]|uniref:septum formation family protein n=1 Tax=Microbacterium sp. JZ31 TaxID=1906274 RepID=UPI001931F9E2|nr:septum formation family protein [Microbacterium sp. JZ31]